MTKIVRTFADGIYPFCMLYGFYIVAHGHLTPGGGFQGGAVMATATALLLVAHRQEEITERVRLHTMKLLEAAGLVGFLLAAFTGLLLAKPFFQNWAAEGSWLFGHAVAFGPNNGDLWTSGLMPLMNLAVGVEVLAAMTVILLSMFAGIRETKA